ncbi:hypothetical protein AB0J82_36630 [Asanoa sp. NPDC049518]|uniref:hypothetical protein n=1 Tax=unclassified Asanoa TaxID=2685164 RepID=UPI0034226A1F
MARRRREVSDEDRRQAIEDYRVEVAQFQWVARRNARWVVAIGCMFFGLLGLWSLIDSSDNLAGNILMLAGGLAAAATFFVRSWTVLWAAVVVTIAGLVWILL